MIPVLGTQAWPTVSPRDRKSPRLSRPQFPHQHTEMAALALRASQTSEGAVRPEGRGTVASGLRRHELLGGRTSAALRQVAEGGLQRGGPQRPTWAGTCHWAAHVLSSAIICPSVKCSRTPSSFCFSLCGVRAGKSSLRGLPGQSFLFLLLCHWARWTPRDQAVTLDLRRGFCPFVPSVLRRAAAGHRGRALPHGLPHPSHVRSGSPRRAPENPESQCRTASGWGGRHRQAAAPPGPCRPACRLGPRAVQNPPGARRGPAPRRTGRDNLPIRAEWLSVPEKGLSQLVIEAQKVKEPQSSGNASTDAAPAPRTLHDRGDLGGPHGGHGGWWEGAGRGQPLPSLRPGQLCLPVSYFGLLHVRFHLKKGLCI